MMGTELIVFTVFAALGIVLAGGVVMFGLSTGLSDLFKSRGF